MNRTWRKGFTLIELLVVIAIIAILAAILFPVFAQAREKARQTACLSNSKQIGTAFHMYTSDYDEVMPLFAYVNNNTGDLLNYWHAVLMPYIKSKQVFVCPSAQKLSPVTDPSSMIECDPRQVADPGPSTDPNWDPWIGSGSYGFNHVYLGGGTESGLAQSEAGISEPADTVALTEITKLSNFGTTFPGSYWPEDYPWWNCSGNPTVKMGLQIAEWHNQGNNIVFCDGHAKWMKKSALGDYNHDGKLDDGWFCLNKTDADGSVCAIYK